MLRWRSFQHVWIQTNDHVHEYVKQNFFTNYNIINRDSPSPASCSPGLGSVERSDDGSAACPIVGSLGCAMSLSLGRLTATCPDPSEFVPSSCSLSHDPPTSVPSSSGSLEQLLRLSCGFGASRWSRSPVKLDRMRKIASDFMNWTHCWTISGKLSSVRWSNDLRKKL